MTYSATWTNGNTEGRIKPGDISVHRCDLRELTQAVNRRLVLTYQAGEDFSVALATSRIGGALLRNLRQIIEQRIVNVPAGTIKQSPMIPESMKWLWPVADTDENKVIVTSSPGPGEVNLFQKLNGTAAWTDPSLADGMPVRAVHVNELRQCLEWLCRARYVLPIEFGYGLFSIFPDTTWVGYGVANDGADELRSAGVAQLRSIANESLGLSNVTVRSGSVTVTTEADRALEFYRLNAAIDYDSPERMPCWNWPWSTPGALGDATLISTISTTAGTPAVISGAAMISALQAMVDGAPMNFLMRQADSDYAQTQFSADLTLDFDLNTPPN